MGGQGEKRAKRGSFLWKNRFREELVIVENGGRIDLGHLWRLGVVSKNDSGYGDQLIGILDDLCIESNE